MGYDRESIIRKLKKLRDKATSAQEIGSEAEAQTFAEAVQRMLSEYKVEEAEIREADGGSEEKIVTIRPQYAKYGLKVKRGRNHWMEELGGIVSWSHYCRLLIIPGTNMVEFVGRQVDAETASEVFGKLAFLAENLADKEYVNYFYECKAAGNVKLARGFRASFLLGFVSRMRRRYQEHVAAIREYYASNGKALAVLKTARDSVDDYVEKNIFKKAPEIKSSGVENVAGYRQGQKVAAGIDLSGHKQVGGDGV